MNQYPEPPFPLDIDLSIVVPLHDEQASVRPLLESINRVYKRYADDELWEVILVDDGSRDATVKNAMVAAEDLALPVTVLEFRRNYGQTAAMQAGIDHAAGQFIVTMDGDLQNDPADIPMMRRHLESRNLDLLVGRREQRQDDLFLRLIPSWIANRLIARVTGVPISDNGCSLKVYRASIIKQVSLLGEMHRFIPAWVCMHTPEARIGEITVRHHARQFGESKYGISRTIRVVLDLLTVRFFMKYRARPSHFFGTAGLASGLFGMLLVAVAVVASLFASSSLAFQLPLVLGAMCVVIGVQLVGTGVVAEVVSRIYHDSAGHPTYTIAQSHEAATDESEEPDRSQIIPFPQPGERRQVG